MLTERSLCIFHQANIPSAPRGPTPLLELMSTNFTNVINAAVHFLYAGPVITHGGECLRRSFPMKVAERLACPLCPRHFSVKAFLQKLFKQSCRCLQLYVCSEAAGSFSSSRANMLSGLVTHRMLSRCHLIAVYIFHLISRFIIITCSYFPSSVATSTQGLTHICHC